MKYNKFKMIGVLVACALFGALGFSSHAAEQGKKAKYVFLFIGDGMGLPQRAAYWGILG